jgi:hypothetical protein
MFDIDSLVLCHERQFEKKARTAKYLAPQRRKEDNSIYGWQCKECGGRWKVYQNPYHLGDCSHMTELQKRHCAEIGMEERIKRTIRILQRSMNSSIGRGQTRLAKMERAVRKVCKELGQSYAREA